MESITPKIHAKFDELRELKAKWGYGDSLPIDEKCIQKALSILPAFMELLGPDVFISPMESGGIGMEWMHADSEGVSGLIEVEPIPTEAEA